MKKYERRYVASGTDDTTSNPDKEGDMGITKEEAQEMIDMSKRETQQEIDMLKEEGEKKDGEKPPGRKQPTKSHSRDVKAGGFL